MRKSTKKAPSAGSGAIKNHGGDYNDYLGHFRSPDVMKRGHNQGDPSGMATATPTPLGGMTASAPPATQTMGSLARSGPKMAAKPTFNPLTNPIAATRQQNRADVAAAKLSGGNVGAVRKQNRADLREAVGVRQSRNKAGLGASDTAALRAAKAAPAMEAKAGLKSASEAVRSARQALRTTVRGSGGSKNIASQANALNAAKAARKSVRGGGLGSLV